MSGYGKGVSPITSQTSAEKRGYLDERGRRLNWSRAEVVTQILDFWFMMGAPALSELDALAPPMKVPDTIVEPLRPYWAHLVPFEANDDRSPTPQGEAARLLARSHKAAKATGAQRASSRSAQS